LQGVAKERLKSPRARLFVALDLPERVRDGLVAWQRAELAGDPALRLLRPEQIHITLAFLGYHPERDVERIAAVVAGIATPAPELRFEPEPVGVPRGKNPRLLAVDASSEGAVELQADASARLADAGFYEPEKRLFWPHLTVARVRSERREGGSGRGRRSRRPMAISRPPGPLPRELLRPFVAVRVALYRSILRPQGAEYLPVADVELPQTGGEEEI
jgi:2'-5' RNA ligase